MLNSPPPKISKKYLVIGALGSHGVLTKNWFVDRFKALTTNLTKHHTVLQLGSLTEPLLPGMVDFRGKTNIPQAAAILKGAQCFIGQVGGLMHLARAVDCPAVIIFGGREGLHQSSYSANINLRADVPCSPCWIIKNCQNEMACMAPIQTNDVLEAISNLLNLKRKNILPAGKISIA